jgi:Fe-S-cluster containining protein
MDTDEILRLVRETALATERNEQMLAEFGSVFETLLTILQKKGELAEGHLRLIDKLRKRARVVSQPQIELNGSTNKYEVENSSVDCDKRMHLCHGRCCSFNVKLSKQDLKEGKLEWRIDQPYLLAQTEQGYCVYQNAETGFCGNYDPRPAPCREYDCRDDARIWIDFEKMIPAPMPPTLITIRRKTAND